MLKVGLTGGIGSGKSTVSEMLRGKGFIVIDADVISREVLEKYPQVRDGIKQEFGVQFFDEEGKLLRRNLGDFVFKYPRERRKLEEIVIPYIKSEIFNKIEEYDKSGVNICIVDAPTLIEHRLNEAMDYNILVWVDRSKQILRLKQRDEMTDSQILDRINSQMSMEEKKDYVDFVIDNNLELSYTSSQIDNIINVLLKCCTE